MHLRIWTDLGGGGGVKPLGRALLLGLAALAAAVVALDLAQSVQAQGDEQSGRIVARRLDDGRTEFGWQPAGGERVLPRARYFPAGADVGRWLNSSPVEVGGVEIGRINARLREDGRIEFAFTPADGERILPPSRYFPADAAVGYWLRSTEIRISQSEGANPFTAVSAGSRHTCGLRESGVITCWGDHLLTAAPAGSFIAVSSGNNDACGIRESGEIECWGWSGRQLNDAAPPIPFVAVRVGWSHACGLRESGEIECWGVVFDFASGTEQPVGPAPAGKFTAVSANKAHTCALRESGEVVCWGINDFGQASAPTGSFTAVSAGNAYTCGLREGGAIECWGHSPHGLSDLAAGGFRAVSAGHEHACGLRENGEVECWGRNTTFALRDGIEVIIDTGQANPPASRFTAVDAGHSHTCGLREDGAIECWGWNDDGQTDTPDP